MIPGTNPSPARKEAQHWDDILMGLKRLRGKEVSPEVYLAILRQARASLVLAHQEIEVHSRTLSEISEQHRV